MPKTTSIKTSGLRVAIIGLGRMGLRHMEIARSLDMEICGLADVNPLALEAANNTDEITATAFTDGIEMLKCVRPDGLVVATTAPTHASYVIAAAELGVRYILCEKPLATSLAEADLMKQACEKFGTRLAVNHQMRYMDQYIQVKRLIGTVKFGSLISIIVAGSNFGLAMNASHYFEMFRYITGERVHNIQAWFDDVNLVNPRGPQFEDRAGRILAKSSSGKSLFIDFSSGAGWGLQVIYICRNGQIFVDELNGEMRVAARQEQYRELPTSRYGMPADVRTEIIPPTDVFRPTMDLWRALLAGKDYPNIQDGIHVLECLVAAHASHHAAGKVFSIDCAEISHDQVFPWA